MAGDNTKTGIVHLVGAGPGDPELATLKAMRLLRGCDVVVYDNLVPDELLATLPDHIERVYVGKRAGKHRYSQEQINELLAKLANDGKNVVRLKGGDPLVFGRGGEEAQYLKEHGILFEIVPGITAGVAAPAYVGIPCTDRQRASSVTFVTGHKAAGHKLSEVPWDWVGHARGGTLVIYMGVSEIENIVGRLLEAGMSPDMPSAAIERGSLPTQRIACAPLSQLAAKVREEKIRPPTLFVIGETVSLHEVLSWREDRPLLGARVLVTRPADQSEELYRELRTLGAEVQPFPTVATQMTSDKKAWHAVKALTAEQRYLIFTSENGVRYFLRQCPQQLGDVRALAAFKIAAVGEGAARALQASLLSIDLTAERPGTSALVERMIAEIDLKHTAVVRVRGDLGDATVEQRLSLAGAKVVPLEVYSTHPVRWPEEVRDKLRAHPPDVVLFTSGLTVRALADNLSDEERHSILGRAALVSIGPSTSRAIRSQGMPVALETQDHTLAGMVGDLVSYWQTRTANK
jgi:uroporphyrinogen III methyltransferase/synthase